MNKFFVDCSVAVIAFCLVTSSKVFGDPSFDGCVTQLLKHSQAPAVDNEIKNIPLGAVGSIREPDYITPEIAALARGLRNDPVRIYNYVANKIESEVYFGSKKGAHLTLLEGGGNDFDKASLLVALLRSAGHSPSYQYGWVEIPYESTTDDWDLMHILKLNANPFAGLTQTEFEESGHCPVEIKTFLDSNITLANWKRITLAISTLSRFGYIVVKDTNDSGAQDKAVLEPLADGTGVRLRRVWVSLGSDQLDPWPQQWSKHAGVDILQWAGYNHEDVMTEYGGSYHDPNQDRYENSNAGVNLGLKLETYTNNFLTQLEANAPNATVEEILGSWEKKSRNVTAIGQGFPLTQIGTPTAWLQIPQVYRSYLQIGIRAWLPDPNDPNVNIWQWQHQGFWFAELRGDRLAVVFDDEDVVLYRENTEAARYPLGNTAEEVKVKTVPWHPTGNDGDGLGGIAGLEKQVDYQRDDDRDNQHIIMYAFQPRGGSLHARENILDALVAEVRRRFPSAISGEQIDYDDITDGALKRSLQLEMLNVQGHKWLYQTTLSTRIFSDLNGNHSGWWHAIGRMSQEASYFIDIYQALSAQVNLLGDREADLKGFYTSTTFASALEHAVIEQSSEDAEGASTVRMINYQLQSQLSGQSDVNDGVIYFDEDNKNTLTIKQGYNGSSVDTATTEKYKGLVDQDNESKIISSYYKTIAYDVTYPAIRTYWSAYALYSPSRVGMIIGAENLGSANGGYSMNLSSSSILRINPWRHYSSNYGLRSTRVVGNSFKVVSPSFTKVGRFGADPVDVSTGAFLYAKDLLSLGEGEAPEGLEFKVYYNSRMHRHNTVKLGNGWTHNWDMRVITRSRPEAILGKTTPAQMSSYLIATAVANAVMNPDSEDIKEWLVPMYCAEWGAERTIRTCRSIVIGREAVDFIEVLPDTYVAPANTTMSLTKVGNDLYLKQRQGNQIRFNKRGHGYRIDDPYSNRYCSISYHDDLVAYIFVMGDFPRKALKFNYSGSGENKRLTSVDALNTHTGQYSVSFQHNGKNLDTITDSENKLTRMFYNDGGVSADDSLITSMKDHNQRFVVKNFYDDFQRVIEQHSEGDSNKKWQFYYSNYCNTEEDPYGGLKEYCYDDRSRLVSEIDQAGTTKIIEYDGNDHKVSETILAPSELAAWDPDNPQANPFQKRVEYDFDGATHNLTDRRIWLKAGENPRTTSYTYDLESFEYRPLTVTNPLGHVTTYVYLSGNTTANPDEVHDHDGNKTLYGYETSGWNKWKRKSVTDRDGHIKKFEYWGSGANQGYLKKAYAPGDDSVYTEYLEYDAIGNLTKMKDPNGVYEYYEYDNNRRRTLMERGTASKGDPSNTKREYVYDDDGHLHQEIVHTGRNNETYTITRTYSATGKLLKTYFQDEAGTPALADDPYEEKVYDLADRLLESYDVKRFKTIYAYYADGQLKKKILPPDPKTGAPREFEYTYDFLGRKVDSFDVLDRNTHTARTFDQSTVLALGNGVKLDKEVSTDPMNYTVTRYVDRGGNLRALVNRRGKTFEMDYDSQGRVRHIRTPQGKTVTNDYTPEGRLNKVTEASNEIFDHEYYPVGHARAGKPKTTDFAGTTVSFDSYDKNGNLLQVSEASKQVTRTYDAHNRISTYTNDEGYTIGYSYYLDGLIKEIHYPKGTTDNDPFDETSDPDFDIVTYDYYRNGRIKTITDWHNRVTNFHWHTDGRLDYLVRPNSTVRKLHYDTLARLAGITERDSTNQLLLTFQLGYKATDEIDHRFNWPNSMANQTFHAISGGAHNDDNAIASLNGHAFGYDDDGNLQTGFIANPAQLETATWDARNRLTGIGTTTYRYDMEGNRVEMTHGGLTTKYLVDPHSGPVSRVLMRIKPDGTKVRYIWGMGMQYEVEDNGAGGIAHYYHYDNTGSTAAITNQAQTVVDRLQYAPYGQVLYRQASFDTPFLFSGFLGIQSDPNGLLNMRARYYSPVLRRFISSDPKRFKGGLNWYAYAAGNPITWADPTGFGPSSVLGSIQTGLSAMGMLPGVGAVFDLMNAGISAIRGDSFGVATNLASAIPGIGQGVAAAKIAGGAAGLYGGYRMAKWGVNSLRSGSNVTKASKISNVGSSSADWTNRQFAQAVLSNPVAAKAYQRIQKAGFNVRLNHSRRATDFGDTTSRGVVNIYTRNNKSVGDAVSTLVHESSHVDDFVRNGGSFLGRRGEYKARAREFYFKYGRRPNSAQRAAINRVIDRDYNF